MWIVLGEDQSEILGEESIQILENGRYTLQRVGNVSVIDLTVVSVAMRSR
jgi:hypothetical protein